MTEKAPPPEKPKSREHSFGWKKRIALGLAGTALWGVTVNGLANDISRANNPHDGPTTSVVDAAITTAQNPEEAAKQMEVRKEFIEQCRESHFVIVIFSGTGMETSHYTANMIQDLVQKMGGCVMYHWYGSSYNAKASSESVAEAIDDVTPPGEKKEVGFIGESFGGIAAEDISMEPAIADSKIIELRTAMMIETPVDLSDATETLFGVPLAWLKDLPIPEFNDLTMLLNSFNGQYLRNELGVQKAYDDSIINAAKTSPQLTHDEVERIQQGMRINPNLPIVYIGSSDSTRTVDHKKAYDRIDAMTNAKTAYILIHGADHDEIWLVTVYPQYIPALVDALTSTFGKES